MKKLLLLFLIFSLKATADEAEEILLKKKSAVAYQTTQNTCAKPIDSQPGTSAEPPRVVFEKSCCGIKGIDPFEACSFVCLSLSMCLQCLQG